MDSRIDNGTMIMEIRIDNGTTNRASLSNQMPDKITGLEPEIAFVIMLMDNEIAEAVSFARAVCGNDMLDRLCLTKGTWFRACIRRSTTHYREWLWPCSNQGSYALRTRSRLC